MTIACFANRKRRDSEQLKVWVMWASIIYMANNSQMFEAFKRVFMCLTHITKWYPYYPLLNKRDNIKTKIKGNNILPINCNRNVGLSQPLGREGLGIRLSVSNKSDDDVCLDHSSLVFSTTNVLWRKEKKKTPKKKKKQLKQKKLKSFIIKSSKHSLRFD